MAAPEHPPSAIHHLSSMSLSDPLEFAVRHIDPAAMQPWAARQATPAEELMRAEEPEEEELTFAGMFRLVLVFCFSDAQTGGWHMPVARALAIVREFFPSESWVRGTLPPQGAPGRPCFGLDKFDELMRDEPAAAKYLKRVMRYVLPHAGEGHLLEAGKRLFLLAKAWLPHEMSEVQLSRDKVRWVVHEMSYEDLAIVFGEMPANADAKTRGRARARWCALKSRLIEQPVRAAGERIEVHFSKSASTREKYRQAQMGNQNRKGRKG